jgi:hypothetical protein
MDLVRWIRNQWDRFLAWSLAGAGGLALILGWIGVTGTPYSWEQIPYVISGGLGGLYLLGLGAMFWFTADLRDEWRKLDELGEIEERMLELHELAERRASTVANGRTGKPKAERSVRAPRPVRAHADG